jgi:hypothetical protein
METKRENYKQKHVDGSPATAELKAKEIPMGQLPRRIASLVNLVVNTSV